MAGKIVGQCAPETSAKHDAEERRRILLVGAQGYVGSFLMETLQGLGDVVGVSRSTSPLSLDVADPAACTTVIRDFRPQVVVLASAVSSPAECEKNPEHAWSVNVPSHFLDAVAALDASVTFILLSTDQVHNGEAHLVKEEHPTEPINVYGRTKVAVEQLVQSTFPHSIILRLSFVYGPTTESAHDTFLQFALSKLQSGGEFAAFTDQVRSAVYINDVLEAVRLSIQGQLTGCVNIGGPAALSRYEFCEIVAGRCGLSSESMSRALSSAHAGAVPVPLDISMDVSKFEIALGRKATSLEEALVDMKLAKL